MASDEVKLLGHSLSPYVLRVRIALNIKALEHEYQHEDVLVKKSDLLLKSNPIYKKIPVLIHGGKPICESAVILHYIDEVWTSGPSLLPSDPYDRAIARFWCAYIDDKWYPSLRRFLLSEGEQVKNAALEEVIQGLDLFEDAFIKCSKGQTFFGGDKIGYLDISFGCFLAWIRVIKKAFNVSLIDESKTPKLFEWAQHFSADVAVKDVIPETDELYEFSKFFISVAKV